MLRLSQLKHATDLAAEGLRDQCLNYHGQEADQDLRNGDPDRIMQMFRNSEERRKMQDESQNDPAPPTTDDTATEDMTVPGPTPPDVPAEEPRTVPMENGPDRVLPDTSGEKTDTPMTVEQEEAAKLIDSGADIKVAPDGSATIEYDDRDATMFRRGFAAAAEALSGGARKRLLRMIEAGEDVPG